MFVVCCVTPFFYRVFSFTAPFMLTQPYQDFIFFGPLCKNGKLKST